MLPAEANESDGIKILADERTLRLTDGHDQKQFTVDELFDSRLKHCTQAHLFHQVGRDLVQQSLNGYNVCIFAYGHTGSGKTYTMLGDGMATVDAPGSPCSEGAGFLQRFVSDVFAAHQQEEQSKALHYSCEFYEVYNERIRDLLATSRSDKKLEVRVHPKHGVRVDGICTSVVSSLEETLSLLNFGRHMRTVASTTMNERSSRSHAIFTLRFEQFGESGTTASTYEEVESGTQEKQNDCRRESTVMFVDLAGREDQGTGLSKEARFREMCYINTSLFHLARLISKLSEGRANTASLADFRNSKLTMVLTQALGGNSRTALMATLAPPQRYFADSVSTMSFAQAVKKIQTRPVVNNKSTRNVVSELEAEVARLRGELGEAKTGQLEKEHELLGAQALIRHYKQSWEDAVSQSKEMSRKRSLVSIGLGLPDPTASGTHLENSVPFLTKLSDDPSLQGCCNFFLCSSRKLRLGSDDACDVIVHGVGIQPRMCEVFRETENISVRLCERGSHCERRFGLGDGDEVVLKESSWLEEGSDFADSGSEDGDASEVVSQEAAPRVLVNGQQLLPRKPIRLEHGGCLILGYAHAFRLVVPSSSRIQQAGTSDPIKLARGTVSDLGMTSAASESGVVFKDLYRYLNPVSTRTPQNTVEELIRSLQAACPLVEEANLITREVFGSSELKFQLQVLTNLFDDQKNSLP